MNPSWSGAGHRKEETTCRRSPGQQAVPLTSAFVCLCDSTHLKCVQTRYTHFRLVFTAAPVAKTHLCETKNPFRREAAQSTSFPRLDTGAIGGEGQCIAELPQHGRERSARSFLRQSRTAGEGSAGPCPRAVSAVKEREKSISRSSEFNNAQVRFGPFHAFFTVRHHHDVQTSAPGRALPQFPMQSR